MPKRATLTDQILLALAGGGGMTAATIGGILGEDSIRVYDALIRLEKACHVEFCHDRPEHFGSDKSRADWVEFVIRA